MNERDFKGVWIPRELYLDPALSWTEKILIIEIDSLDNDKEKGCFASNKHLAEFVGKSEGTVANIISKLKKESWVFEIYNDGRNRGLRIKPCEIRFHENVKALSRKREHSNTEREEEKTNMPSSRKSANIGQAIIQVFDYWKQALKHPKAVLDEKRKRKITDRLKAGYSAGDLEQAIRGLTQSPHHMGKNETGTIYDDITLICRDSTHVEMFMAFDEKEKDEVKHQSLMPGSRTYASPEEIKWRQDILGTYK